MDRLISEKAVLEAFREYQGSISDFYKAVKAIPSAYKGMTNGEVMHKLFPNDCFVVGEYGFDEDWWDSPYDPQERSE